MTLGPAGFDWAKARRRVHLVLESGGANDHFASAVHQILVVTTIASVICVVLGTVPEIRQKYALPFALMEAFAVAVFTAEHLARLWGAPDNIAWHSLNPWRARLRYCITFPAIIDFIAILPPALAGLNLAGPHEIVLLQLVRFFKITRYSPGMRSLLAALKSEQRALFAFGVILLGLVLLTGGAMYVAEPCPANPEAVCKFSSIPQSMYWAVVTLTTTGYGDIVPDSPAGRIVASATMILGVMMVALPVGIVATAFANELHKRDFNVNPTMIQRMPLFTSLKAEAIYDIMQLLQTRQVRAGAMIVRKGEEAHSMFFVSKGEVSVELPGGSIRLGEGKYFGEMAILQRTRRSADVRASLNTKLLVLTSGDFHGLIERNPEIGEAVRLEAEKRASHPPGSAKPG